MGVHEQQKVISLLSAIGNPDNYYCNLQLMYNNKMHFTTVNSGICNKALLKDISDAVMGTDEELVVQGTIHENFHESGIILDLAEKRLPVYDTYIRMLYKGQIMHILVQPPRLARNTLYIYDIGALMGCGYCDMPHMMIPLLAANEPDN